MFPVDPKSFRKTCFWTNSWFSLGHTWHPSDEVHRGVCWRWKSLWDQSSGSGLTAMTNSLMCCLVLDLSDSKMDLFLVNVTNGRSSAPDSFRLAGFQCRFEAVHFSRAASAMMMASIFVVREQEEEQQKHWNDLQQYFGVNDRFQPPPCSKPPPKVTDSPPADLLHFHSASVIVVSDTLSSFVCRCCRVFDVTRGLQRNLP